MFEGDLYKKGRLYCAAIAAFSLSLIQGMDITDHEWNVTVQYAVGIAFSSSALFILFIELPSMPFISPSEKSRRWLRNILISNAAIAVISAYVAFSFYVYTRSELIGKGVAITLMLLVLVVGLSALIDFVKKLTSRNIADEITCEEGETSSQ